MTEITITRRSKVGFGYNTQPTGNGTEIMPTTEPIYTGTIKQVAEELETCPTLRSMVNTYKTTAWFVRKDGKWLRVLPGQWAHPRNLLLKILNRWNEWEYAEDSIDIQVEALS